MQGFFKGKNAIAKLLSLFLSIIMFFKNNFDKKIYYGSLRAVNIIIYFAAQRG